MNNKAKKHAPIEAGQTVSDAIAAVLRQNLDYLTEWEHAARSWDDIEGVHQTRVAFRRMRSALTIFRPVIPKAVSVGWAEQMRDLAGRLGKARDLDVFIDEALGGLRDKLHLAGGERLESLTQQQRCRAYEAVRAMLEGQEYKGFKQDFRGWVQNHGWEREDLKKKHRKLLDGPLVVFARKVLDLQERRVLEAGAHVDKYDAAAMHRLRIQCKKLRYATEFFFPLFPGMDEFIGHMKGLQDLLGVMNDVTVMRVLLDEILAGTVDPEVRQYAGGVIGWRTCYCHEHLYDFERRWEEFVEAKHPWWKKEAAKAKEQQAS
jgi:CHAD domain-containing protein